MKNFKDAVKGVRFSFGNKDSYTRDEIYEIIDQHSNAIISNVGREVEREFEEFENSKKTWESTLQSEKEKLSQFDKQLNEYKEKASSFETEIKQREEVINKYKTKEEVRTAQELLGGMVAQGAEVDAYKMLGSAIQEIRFESDETIDSRKEKIKPIVNGLIQTKRYLAPQGAEFDESGKLIISKNTAEDKGDSNEESQSSSSALRRYS